MAQDKTYLAMCAIYRNEAPFLREWVEFHRLVGVDRFFLYNHRSEDDHETVLRPYVDACLAVVHDWLRFPDGQVTAYDECLRTHGKESRWIAFIDVDEFLFSPTGRPLSEILVDYEDCSGVGANVVLFGTSGHQTRPEGLVLENYVYRRRNPPAHTKKCIVDPSRTSHCRGAHSFAHPGTVTSDENKQPIYGPYTTTFSVSRLRVNHYYTKSEEELREKFERPTADDGRMRESLPRTEVTRLSEVRDDVIQMYLPALRAALDRHADAPVR